MKNLRKTILWISLLLTSYTLLQGQIENHQYKRPLIGVETGWHQLGLPASIFGKIQADFDDLRIIGIAEGDTIQAPFMMQQPISQKQNQEYLFPLLNQSQKDGDSYFTLENKSNETIDRIRLAFSNTNYNWDVTLAGSFDQKQWFGILDQYRLMAIDNKWTTYSFNQLYFSPVNYPYLRIKVKAPKESPELNRASFKKPLEPPLNLKEYTKVTQTITFDKNAKTTIIELDLDEPIPLGTIGVEVLDSNSFYRFVGVEFVRDSFVQDEKIEYSYRKMASGVLNSKNKVHQVKLDRSIRKKIRLLIFNEDNQPLTIGKVTVMMPQYHLLFRADRMAKYYLFYGDPNAYKPKYDIRRHSNEIPDSMKMVDLGAEEFYRTVDLKVPKPFLLSPVFLWGIMLLIILLLGWFTFDMIRKKSE